MFEVKTFFKDRARIRLIIFTSEEKTHCYEYYWNQTLQNYVCYECKIQKKYVSANLFKNENQKTRKKKLTVTAIFDFYDF